MTNNYKPTPEDLKLIEEARSAFSIDHTYLEQILWEARRRNKNKA